MTPIRKALIPASGYSTRMLPITRAVSKEMLTLVDRPVIQYVVQELIDAGITDITIVTRPERTEIRRYFGAIEPGLRAQLSAGSPEKQQLLLELERMNDTARFTFVDNPPESEAGGYGTGIPVLLAERQLEGEPFIYTFSDDFFYSQTNGFQQMLAVYEQYGAPVLGCLRMASEADYAQYGYVDGERLADGLLAMSRIVEKPGAGNAPSDLASLGFYIGVPEMLEHLKRNRAQLAPGQELYFNQAYNDMIAEGRQVLAREIVVAEYFDTGNKLEYMKTAVAMAARHPEIGADFRQFLGEFVTKEK